MVRKLLLMATTIAAVIAISACSSGPQTTSKGAGDATQEPPKPAAAITARSAYFQLYKPAREWAPDLLALTLKSGEVPNVNNEEGRAGLWTAVFVSPSRKEARTFSYAVADSGTDIHKGLNVSDKQIWGGATPAAKAFVNGEFTVDSDAAYKSAAEKAAGWLKTHPKAKPVFILGNSSRFPGPVWYIMWGTNKDGYVAYVDASTGMVVK